MAVIDASVYVALVTTRDAHHARAATWFEECIASDSRRAAPNLLVVEVAAALARVADDSAVVAPLLSRLRSDGLIELFELTGARAEAAATLAARTGVRGADAVYLALASELSEPLVTFDRQQADRGAAVAEVVVPGEVTSSRSGS